jgi:hypothetical protein
LPTEPFPFRDEHATDLGDELSGRCRVVDGELLSWHGVRLESALPYLVELAGSLAGG